MSNKNSPKSNRLSWFVRASEISKSRAMTLYATGVVIGLILGGIGLFNARGTTTNKVSPENVAIVNQRPILRSDFVAQLESETGLSLEETTREDQLRVLDEMLREELFVQRGLELDFAETDQATRYALYDVVEQQATADVFISKATEEEFQAYFNKHKENFKTHATLNVHNLLLPEANPTKAAEAAQALRDGASLDDVKQRYGLSEGQYYSNDRDYLAKAHLGDEIYAQVEILDSGQVSDPILTDNGYHIVQVVHYTKPQQQTFDQARDDVQRAYYDAKTARVLNNVTEFLRARAEIFIADDFADYDPAKVAAQATAGAN